MKKTNLFLIATLFSANALAVDIENALAVDIETEPNNKMNEANPITPGVMLEGQNSGNPREDWFVFETSQSDILTFTLNRPDWSMIVKIFDADKNELYNITTPEEGTFTSKKIGLKNNGKFFIRLTSGHRESFDYNLTLNLENQAPFTEPGVADCPTIQNPRFSSATGILDLPAVDVDDVFGNLTTYKASMELVTSPSGGLTFKVKDASKK